MEEAAYKIQWHPAFCSAVRLELRGQKQELFFENEHNLNSKPLQIDLLVIKKRRDVVLDNEIGRIFRGHNLLEYKSPEEGLNVDTYYKTLAYACLYKAAGGAVDAVKAEDITISLVRNGKPEGLFRFFKEKGYLVPNPYNGIYYVKKEGFFDTQVIVSKELDSQEHVWLRSLQKNLSGAEILDLLSAAQGLGDEEDKQSADSVLDVMAKANQEKLNKAKEDGRMSQALMELMAPEINKIRETAAKEAAEKAAKEAKEAAEKAVKEAAEKAAEKTAEATAIAAFENGLDFSLVCRLIPGITEKRLQTLKKQVVAGQKLVH